MRSRTAIPLLCPEIVALLIAVGSSSAVYAAPVVITFEEVAGSRTAVINQYADRGVTFNQPTCLDYSLDTFLPPNFAHSGTKGIEQCFALEFCSVPIEATFTTGQRRVKAWFGYSSPNQNALNVVLTAFNDQGQQVGQTTVPLPIQATPQPIRSPIEVTASGKIITRVSLTLTSAEFPTVFSNSFAVDDLEFDTEGPPPTCNAATVPSLSLTSPTTGSVTQIGSFILSGLVSTPTPLIEATLTVAGSGGASYTSDLISPGLIPTGGGTFGSTRYSPLFPGTNTITVHVANCKGERNASRTITYNPLPTGIKLVLDLVEVTQAIQRDDNAITLVAGKRTVARAFLRVEGAPGLVINNVTATLFGARADGSSPGGPFTIPSLNKISVGSDTTTGPRRLNINGTLNFELPPEWITEGRLTCRVASIQIEGNPTSLSCPSCENRTQFGNPKLVEFEEAPPLRVVLWSVPYTVSGVTHEPLQTDFDHLTSWLRRAYPTADVQVSTRRLGAVNEKPKADFDCDDVNHRLSLARFVCFNFSCIDTQSGGSRVHWYGMVSDDVEFMRGCSAGIPSRIASGPTGSGTWGWDTDGSYADWYGGHELAHTYDRKHPGFCNGNSDDDDDFPYQNGIIGWTGFDVGDSTLGIPMAITRFDTFHDVMTYCDFQWMSDYTYEGILDYMRDLEGGGGGGGVPLANALIVQGGVNLTRNQASLRPLLRLPGLEPTPRPATSQFSIELRSAGGAVLAKYPFQPAEDTEAVPGEDLLASFDLVVPWVDGTKRVVVLKGAAELASRTASANAPQVKLISPNGPATFQNGTIPVRWQASDADGDSLLYVLLYSPDAGATWHPVDADLTSVERDVPVADLPGGDKAIFRVIASDGLNTAVDDQDVPVKVAQKPPVARILSPAEGNKVATDGALVLQGEALDIEDGHLQDASLVWSSNRFGILGIGTSLSVTGLVAGNHVISLQATDSKGATGSASVSIEVTPVPAVAVAEADSPVAPGAVVTLDGSKSRGEDLLTFEWVLMVKPQGSAARVANLRQPVASIRVDIAGTYEVELRMHDSIGQSSVARVMIQARQGTQFIRGEVTGDGKVDISDPVRILGWLFLGDSEPRCLDAADTNDDGRVDLSDSAYMLGYLFLGGQEPPQPFPACGLDATSDNLGCRTGGCP